MNSENVLKTVPILQNQLDSLLEFDANANDLTNGVVNAAFMLLFRDLIRLFACYNNGIINILGVFLCFIYVSKGHIMIARFFAEKFFDMKLKQCREALDLYKKFLVRMDKVSEFFKTAELIGVDKGDIPDLARAPSSLLEALEGHLASLEHKKGKYVSASDVLVHPCIYLFIKHVRIGKGAAVLR